MYTVTIVYSDPASVPTPVTAIGSCWSSSMAQTYIAQMLAAIDQAHSNIKSVTITLARQ